VDPVKSKVNFPVVELLESKLPVKLTAVEVIVGSPVAWSVVAPPVPVKLVIPVMCSSSAEAGPESASVVATATASSIIFLLMIRPFS
jgi:hypothetical protein